jgi:hypothetical protein
MHLLAHGSLAARAAADAPVVCVAGVRRAWGVGMENTEDVPGYRWFARAGDGTRPDVVVAFADLVPDPAASARAVLLPVDDAELARLDARERNYDRVDVTAAIDGVPGLGPGPGVVWAYLGHAAGRARLADAVAAGRAVAARAYRDGIVAAYAARGIDVRAELTGLPLLDLVEHRLPPA